MTAPKGTVRMKCQGPGCGKSFHAKRANQKFCGDSCRSRARRRGPTEADSALVKAVRSELTKANKLSSYVGQAAVSIAAKLEGAGPTAAAGLTRELDRLMTLALGPQAAPPAPDGTDGEPQEDEVDRARKAKEAKAAAIAASQ